MKIITAIIIDDEESSLNLLEYFIQKYCSSSVKIVGKATTVERGIELINSVQPNLLFVDVILNPGTIFDILDEIVQYDYKVIFVTSYDHFAIKAFKYNAIDYVLKPIEIKDIIFSVNRACKEIKKHDYTHRQQIEMLSNSMDNIPPSFRMIAVPSNNKIDFVKLEDIVFCKSDGRYTSFFLLNGRELVSCKNLGKYENMFDEDFFFRIHNSYIVNLKHVLRINKDNGSYCDMVNGKSLPIAKRKQDSLFRFLNIKL